MSEAVAWYLGKCLLSWCLGWAGGALQIWTRQLLEKATSE